MSAVRTSAAVVGRRACAVLAAGSAGLHAVLLGHATNPVFAMVMAAMIIACLYCARDLWRQGTLRIWCVVALMNLAMVALHLPAPGHHHDGGSPGNPSTVLALATTLAMIEVVAAAAVLYLRTRGRPAERELQPPR